MMLRRIAAGLVLALVAVLLGAAFTPPTYPVIDLAAYGAVGDGVAINNGQFNAAFAAASNGGMIRIPCGTYKLTQAPSVTIAAGAHVELVGSGDGCTVLAMSGAINGPTLTLASQWSSVRVADLSITTDQVGTATCLSLVGTFTNPLSAYASTSNIERVTLRGSDITGAWTQYCNIGLLDNSISNLIIDKFTYQGALPLVGTGVKIAGSGTGGTYAVAINIVNSVMNYCATGVVYGDWVQGVVVDKGNITGCQNGVVVSASPVGSLAELVVSNTQINADSCGVCVNALLFPNLQMTNDVLIIEAQGIGVKVQGTNWLVSGTEFDGVSSQTNINSGSGTVAAPGAATITPTAMSGSSINFAPVVVPVPIVKGSFINYDVGGANAEGVFVTAVTGTTFTATFAKTHAAGVAMRVSTNQATGILLTNTSGNGGVVAPSHFTNLGVGISASASQQAYAKIEGSLFVNNTNDYVINTSANGLLIADTMPRNYSALNNSLPCNSSIRFATGKVADSNTTTFYAPAAGGGGSFVNVGCDGSTWHIQ